MLSNAGSVDVRVGERRRSYRAPVSMSIGVKRAGDDEHGTEEAVRAFDISRGGLCISAPSWMHRDDVLEVDLGPMALRGIVVGMSSPTEPAIPPQAHVVFTGLTLRLLHELDRLISHSYVPG